MSCVCVCLCTSTGITIHRKHTHAHTFTHARMQTHAMLWCCGRCSSSMKCNTCMMMLSYDMQIVGTRMYNINCCCRGASSNALKMGHTYAYSTHSMLLIRMHITGRPVAEALPPMTSEWVADGLIRSDWVPSALRNKRTN